MARGVLAAAETSFHQDLNGDGVTGLNIPTTVIESFGSTSLTQVGNNYFLYAAGTSTGPALKISGAAVVPGQYGSWSPIGAESTASGYEVAWKDAATGQYGVWNLDGNGSYIGSVLGAVAGTNSTLQSLETSFHQDLNGDGVTGVPIAELPVQLTAPATGNAVLFGSTANDTFVFGPHFGNDTIVNFQPGQDQIQIDHALFATLSDVFSNTADDANGNAIISISLDQSIKIQDISTQSLQQHTNDFHLV